jgi:ABC-type transport system involved in multi-copper enzyme maturation permease subunit
MERAMSGIYVLSRTISLVQCGLLALLFLFSSHFRLSWRSYVLGIAVGLGTFSSVDLATAAIQVWSGPAAGIHVLLDFVTMGTYHCSVLIWLFYILAPEPAQATVKQLPDVDLEKWNTELQRLLMQ